MTKRKPNPRPRKYASASERQAAYRARAPEVCFRAEEKTAQTLDRIAADLDVSRADLLLSMTKFALTNHDWARFGLTHKPLPFGYGTQADETRKENPMKAKTTKRKPTPAQLAARERFAEAARSGAFKKAGAKKRTTAKANPTKRKPTVSRKISQLVREGYPQKQAVAVALREERAGKVRRNPASSPMVHAYAVIWKDISKGTWHTVALTMSKADATEIAQLLADRNKEQYGVQTRFVHEKDFEVY